MRQSLVLARGAWLPSCWCGTTPPPWYPQIYPVTFSVGSVWPHKIFSLSRDQFSREGNSSPFDLSATKADSRLSATKLDLLCGEQMNSPIFLSFAKGRFSRKGPNFRGNRLRNRVLEKEKWMQRMDTWEEKSWGVCHRRYFCTLKLQESLYFTPFIAFSSQFLLQRDLCSKEVDLGSEYWINCGGES